MQDVPVTYEAVSDAFTALDCFSNKRDFQTRITELTTQFNELDEGQKQTDSTALKSLFTYIKLLAYDMDPSIASTMFTQAQDESEFEQSTSDYTHYFSK